MVACVNNDSIKAIITSEMPINIHRHVWTAAAITGLIAIGSYVYLYTRRKEVECSAEPEKEALEEKES
tara:strand:+ start:59 stop:262 length:204 start_codon:yes stop_codon:yes gene_type:complete